ncbi:MAG: hypothetical protein K6E54_06330 [Bacteroidaceae bacterium]|nr:hypothetical protein [Bacteroidaceae bacterium]
MKKIVALFSLFLLCSCHTVVGNWLKKYADNHLTYGEENANQGRFRVDGCYIHGSTETLDSKRWGYIFYPDGICAEFGFDEVKRDSSRIDFGNSVSFGNTLEEILYPQKWPGLVGVYEIRNDTVYCEMYRWMDLLHICTELWGYKFAIVDSCTLKSNIMSNENNDYNFHFVPCTNIIHPREKFIKDRKWMWKTKEDWLKYKESKKKKK